MDLEILCAKKVPRKKVTSLHHPSPEGRAPVLFLTWEKPHELNQSSVVTYIQEIYSKLQPG